MKKAAPKAKSKATTRKVTRPSLVKAKTPTKPMAQMSSARKSVPAHEKHLPWMSAAVLVLGILVAVAALVLLKMGREIDEQYSAQMAAEAQFQHNIKMRMIDKMKQEMQAKMTPTPTAKPAAPVMMRKY